MNMKKNTMYRYRHIKTALECEGFEETRNQDGYAYFRKQEQPYVMVSVGTPLSQYHMIAIADQAKLSSEKFLDMLDEIKTAALVS